MILKTRVKNNQVARVLRWAERTGVYIETGQTLTLPGAYPTACRDASAIKQFTSEINSKAIEVTLVTDLPIENLTKAEVKKETPKAEDPKPKHKDLVTAERVAETHKEIVEQTDAEHKEAQAALDTQGFAEGTIDKFKPKIESMVLGEMPKLPEPAIRIDEGNQLKRESDVLYETVKREVAAQAQASIEGKKRGRPRQHKELL